MPRLLKAAFQPRFILVVIMPQRAGVIIQPPTAAHLGRRQNSKGELGRAHQQRATRHTVLLGAGRYWLGRVNGHAATARLLLGMRSQDYSRASHFISRSPWSSVTEYAPRWPLNRRRICEAHGHYFTVILPAIVATPAIAHTHAERWRRRRDRHFCAAAGREVTYLRCSLLRP